MTFVLVCVCLRICANCAKVFGTELVYCHLPEINSSLFHHAPERAFGDAAALASQAFRKLVITLPVAVFGVHLTKAVKQFTTILAEHICE